MVIESCDRKASSQKIEMVIVYGEYLLYMDGECEQLVDARSNFEIDGIITVNCTVITMRLSCHIVEIRS